MTCQMEISALETRKGKGGGEDESGRSTAVLSRVGSIPQE